MVTLNRFNGSMQLERVSFFSHAFGWLRVGRSHSWGNLTSKEGRIPITNHHVTRAIYRRDHGR